MSENGEDASLYAGVLSHLTQTCPERKELRHTERRKTMRADIVAGAHFPDYELTDHTRQRRRLSELQGIDPMILVLSRGHFCPKDHQQHLALAAFYPKIAVAYTKIVTISTDNILEIDTPPAQAGRFSVLRRSLRHGSPKSLPGPLYVPGRGGEPRISRLEIGRAHV